MRRHPPRRVITRLRLTHLTHHHAFRRQASPLVLRAVTRHHTRHHSAYRAPSSATMHFHALLSMITRVPCAATRCHALPHAATHSHTLPRTITHRTPRHASPRLATHSLTTRPTRGLLQLCSTTPRHNWCHAPPRASTLHDAPPRATARHHTPPHLTTSHFV